MSFYGNQERERNYLGVDRVSPIFLHNDIVQTTFNQFQAKAIAGCKGNINNTGWIIKDCVEREEHELDLYHKWIDAAVKAKKSESGMRLTLQMANPTDTAKLSHQDDLLAKQVAYQEALKELQLLRWKSGEESNDEVEEAYPVQPEYDRKIPVFVEPANPNRYILITAAACQESLAITQRGS
ncbi:uncharacterized protein VP01_1596g4 [Puccinia sorghi]|uniref:Uncharacterized protein n=1 Tax=Puccinia sorghi TaxID=27349 RepID=A0A0L6VHH6_9BASI|nr:uncharacterized protein VP01_1596g4 [Puccinia sorghi]